VNLIHSNITLERWAAVSGEICFPVKHKLNYKQQNAINKKRYFSFGM